MTETGQCLCGEVKYKFSDPPVINGVCHCKNCQRSGGTAFSMVTGVQKSGFALTAGDPKSYTDSNTATGNSLERYFCGNCGSALYSVIPGRPEMVLIKAGTLDDTSGFKPQFQCWCDTKQDWVTLEDDIMTMAKG
jgi:hypothetical protein